MTAKARPHWLMIAMGLVVLATAAESSAAPKFKVTRCKTDNDCAGTKVCVKNTCEEPAGAAPAACKADTDCPGNQVCSQNKCAEPGGGAAAPAAAPAPAPAYAPPPTPAPGYAPAPATGPAYAPPPTPAPAPAAPASCRTDTECPGNLVCIQNVCAQPGGPAAAPGAAPAPQPYYAQPGYAQPQPGPGAPAAAAPDVEGPVKPGGSFGGLIGDGFKDGYNIGFGIRGGYTLPMHLYVGGTFVYHLGTSRDEFGYSYKANVYYVGGEAGYALAAGPLEIVPYAGIGMAILAASAGGMSDSLSKIAFWPGCMIHYPIGKAFIGGDARFVVVTDANGDANAFSTFFTGGMKF